MINRLRVSWDYVNNCSMRFYLHWSLLGGKLRTISRGIVFDWQRCWTNKSNLLKLHPMMHLTWNLGIELVTLSASFKGKSAATLWELHLNSVDQMHFMLTLIRVHTSLSSSRDELVSTSLEWGSKGKFPKFAFEWSDGLEFNLIWVFTMLLLRTWFFHSISLTSLDHS